MTEAELPRDRALTEAEMRAWQNRPCPPKPAPARFPPLINGRCSLCDRLYIECACGPIEEPFEPEAPFDPSDYERPRK